MTDPFRAEQPDAGAFYADSYTGATLRLLETAASSGGDIAAFELIAPPGWSAGPLHTHPRQVETMAVLDGELIVTQGEERTYRVGAQATVPPGSRHTARNATRGRLALRVEFAPALRTDELFVRMFGGGGRRPPRAVPASLRSLVEARGFSEEIRYAWPRRAAVVLAFATVVVGAVAALRFVR